MKDITLEELLEAGCHFGHQVTRQNPKARDFVFEARDGIHIIDLTKTKEGLDEALAYVKHVGSLENSTLLIVGTKRQASPIVDELVRKAHNEKLPEGQKLGLLSVSKRWVGGTLTNTTAMQKNFAKIRDLEDKLRSDEAKENYTKKEIGGWEKDLTKLNSFYSGIVDMKAMPSVLFVVDTHLEHLAVREANRMGIPVVGIVDTNADPDPIQYVIPANDDAVGSLKLLIGAVMDAWIEGKQTKKEPKEDASVIVSKAKQSQEIATSSAKGEAPRDDDKKGTAKPKPKETQTDEKKEEPKKPAKKVTGEKAEKKVAKVKVKKEKIDK